jgi:signal peptidase II
MKHKDSLLACLVIVAILVIDQIIKISVKTSMALGDQIQITNWFYINFVENIGMAWGMTILNKLVLSLFRIVAIGFIGWYICCLMNEKHRRGYIICLSMILAGAAGNMFDSMFYGLIFSPSTPWNISSIVPLGHGYSSFLMGKVVDMFYFPIINTTWPNWVPLIGGDDFVFFSPVFNFADSCITVGIIVLFLFYRKDMEGIGKTLSNWRKGKTDSGNVGKK